MSLYNLRQRRIRTIRNESLSICQVMTNAALTFSVICSGAIYPENLQILYVGRLG